MKKFKSAIIIILALCAAAAMSACGKSDGQKVAEAKEALTLPGANNVVNFLALPQTGLHDTVITWESSNPDIIGGDGHVVSRPDEHTVVVFTATITLNDVSDTKEFNVTVRGQDTWG